MSLLGTVASGLGIAFVYGAIHIFWNSLVSRAYAQASIASADVLVAKREFHTSNYICAFFWIFTGITVGGSVVMLYIGFTGFKVIAGLLFLLSIIGWLGLWDSKQSRVIFCEDTIIYQSLGSKIQIKLNSITNVNAANGFIGVRTGQRKGVAIPLYFKDSGLILRKLQDCVIKTNLQQA